MSKKQRLDILQQYQSSQTFIGALAAHAIIDVLAAPDIEEDFFATRAEVIVQINSMTTSEGPLMVILYDKELTTAEVQEFLSTEGPLNPADSALDEQVKRAVWFLGGRNGNGLVTGGNRGVATSPIYFDFPGKGYIFRNPEGWALAVANMHPTNALTTGTEIVAHARLFGRWLR